MTQQLRIGLYLWPYEPFLVQLRESIQQHAQERHVTLVPIMSGELQPQTPQQEAQLVEEILSLDLDALITWDADARWVHQLLAVKLPVIYLTETDLIHPLCVSPRGLQQIAESVGDYIATTLNGRGHVVAVGGLRSVGEDGYSRFTGIRSVLAQHPAIRLTHIPSSWTKDTAEPQIRAALQTLVPPIDAIFGFSDPLALVARDAAHQCGLLAPHTLVVGVNGDPLALAAIANGTMNATMLTSAADLGRQSVDLAIKAAQGEPLPVHFNYNATLITRANVAEHAAQKLIALATLPNRLVGYSRRQEQRRMLQLETALDINRRVGRITDRQRLSHEIADVIRTRYEYDDVQLWLWSEAQQCLILEHTGSTPENKTLLDPHQSPVLQTVLQEGEAIFLPNAQHTLRFPPDPRYPHTRSRVVIPIRLGERIIGVLDLHSFKPTNHSYHDLVGLQTLADQLGIAVQNAELYNEAVKARAAAEKADQLKTRLLANVSHELRTPLNVILGYSQSALARPNPYGSELPVALRTDIGYIYQSGEHLIRLINDLLDLSRAEIDELDLYPEAIVTHTFLSDTFCSIAKHATNPAVEWRLELAQRLPIIHADPVRLRQVVLNLLHNAQKFTERGHVTLGAELMPPHLHLWVEDSGSGISSHLQETMFEPFVSGETGEQRRDGVGLGLSITRRLVALHHGTMTVESRLDEGSTFHIYLPLPNVLDQPLPTVDEHQQKVVLVFDQPHIPAALRTTCQRQGCQIYTISSADMHDRVQMAIPHGVQPVALAWDMTRSSNDDWSVLQRIRTNSYLCQLPLMLYMPDDDSGRDGIGITNINLKPMSAAKLRDSLETLQPNTDALTILIVDDDQHMHTMYQHMLEGFTPQPTILHAEHGKAALTLLEHTVPDVMVLDLMMPELDGFGVLDQIRAMEHTRHIPVLIMSGHILSFEALQRLEQAHVTYHSKAILTAAETVQAVHRSLSPQQQLNHQTSALVKRAVAFLQQHYAEPISRQDIAAAVSVNKDYLSRIFMQEMGISPWDYLNRFRVKQAKALLLQTTVSITEIAVQVGFADSAYFSRVFRNETGCSPRTFREHNH